MGALITCKMGALLNGGAYWNLLTKTHSMGGAYSEGGAYWKEGAKSNYYRVTNKRFKISPER